ARDAWSNRAASRWRAIPSRDHARSRECRGGACPVGGRGAERTVNERSRLTNPRVMLAGLILLLWLGGLGFLVRREYFRPNTGRLSRAAFRGSAGGLYYCAAQS